jgi:hypothetical protein
MKLFSGTTVLMMSLAASSVVRAAGPDFRVDTKIGPTSEEAQFKPLVCPLNTIAGAFTCSGSYCDNLYLGCRTVWPGTSLAPNTKATTAAFSEEGAATMTNSTVTYSDGSSFSYPRMLNQNFCPNGLVSGLTCTGRYCDNVALQCTKIATGQLTGCYWSAPWSDEFGGWVTFSSEARLVINGVACSGRYCDNMQFWACQFQPN